ncbi:hypothetical protein RHGRI_029108 [Rhododendron griersonianum]|uniref:Protein FAR1-RELATED SEQUENCE n=1 Tax=Rhododendron griersonianum TaxID=479676 RepID=A0AAV6IK38_9ERIC|nr:hypothetical protein RHGRI_029108 [Rhododendron griersonianum]
MMSSDSAPSAMPPNKECVEKEVVWSGDREDKQKVWSSPSNKKCGEIDTSGVGNEATENCEDGVEELKEGMTFDTSEEAYSYYSRYAKEKGFAMAKRTSRKGKDGKLKDVTIACSRARKARNGKWRLNRVALVHNHDQSPGKASYDKSSMSIEVRRHDNMCNIFNEVADLADESQEKYDIVMKRVHELKRELMEVSVVCESNVVSLGDDTGTRNCNAPIFQGISSELLLKYVEFYKLLDPYLSLYKKKITISK